MIAAASLLIAATPVATEKPACDVEAPTIPAPSLGGRVRDELARAGRMLSRARGIDVMTDGEVRELLVDLALAHNRSLEILDELVKRSLPR